MSSLISYVLTSAEKIPVVGSPIRQASDWCFKHNEKLYTPDHPPPSYEKAISTPSTLTQISDYVWRSTSFSSSSTAVQEEEEVHKIEQEQCLLDKRQIEEGVSLIKMAAQVNHHDTKNQEMSINLYMLGLEKILASLPIDSDPLIKSTLEAKLLEFKQRNHLVLQTVEESRKKQKLTYEQRKKALGGLSELIIQAAEQGAIALKKSPIPNLISSVIQMAKIGLLKVDETCSIRERAINITQLGLAKAIELDEHYEVHHIFAELFYTGCAALLKANAAYNQSEETLHQP
ncbi:hypothetical protein G6F46_008759 [Rhizopus delemar]|uniref:MIT domain-containing protein n=2 Tax=Rhizopus TaxID=4842 RepID=A0A9P6YYZ2_9FUNG|nr:hypothetical protein G6F43_008408 [Rhizopus delemar]KAG1544967.1 hypothetical protein G6F51_005739 [Rhizopus arrhizus]KAG1448690.1 hypothetical protein G6F55_010516 [Rhizopus delemar]KAG1498673.1 hypothetical protein G6F54_004920 [Rhizopus delemar]KAG1507901.1 hypothetical protein G6F53_008601 [Rhizopus delemar]